MEDHFLEPAASAFSHQPPKLSLWPHENSISHLHALDLDWTSTGTFFVCLPRNIGSVRTKPSSGQDSSAHDRVLDLGRRFRYDSTPVFFAQPDCDARHPEFTGKPRRRPGTEAS